MVGDYIMSPSKFTLFRVHTVIHHRHEFVHAPIVLTNARYH